jgi:ATP-dependent Clp protease ATP-binding subunit ClpA
MFERFTGQARSVVVQAQGHARRLGHNYVGCEHLLLAVSGTDSVAADVLRLVGVTPESIESARLQVLADAPAPVLDREALAAVGIDLDTVRERVEASFGPGALTRQPPQQRRRLQPWRRSRRPCNARPAGGYLPFTPRAKRCLERSLREAVARRDGYIGVEHLALAVIATTDGVIPQILSRLGVSAAQARTQILERYRLAG